MGAKGRNWSILPSGKSSGKIPQMCGCVGKISAGSGEWISGSHHGTVFKNNILNHGGESLKFSKGELHIDNIFIVHWNTARNL